MTWRELVSKLKDFGFDGPFSGGKHLFMTKGDLVLTIPNPHRDDISPDLISRLLKQAGISREEWVKK
ncbi:MAG: type II toxin-antitoxin system HicA family toxin [Nanoarchaeota archaeon]